MIENIPELVDAGVDSCKIEGRMKTALYVATVARTYRKAIDDFFESEEKYRQNMPWYLDQISRCTYRQFTTGFYFGKPSEEAQIYDNNTYINEYIYLGIVYDIDERGFARIEQRNKFSVGDEIEIMKPDGTDVKAAVKAMYREDGTSVESCPHSKEIIYLDLSEKPDKFDILRIESKEEAGE
jgi:putative protease